MAARWNMRLRLNEKRIFPFAVKDPSYFNNIIFDYVKNQVVFNNEHPIV
jgi:hypothetical protein